MKYRVVSVLKDNRPRFLIISDIEEIEILPSKYLKHLDQINASPNTVKSAAFALSYYYNYLQEQTIGLDEITLLSYSEQNKHFMMENAWRESEKEMTELYGQDGIFVGELHQINQAVGMNQPIEKLLYEFALRSDCEDIQNFSDVFLFAKRSGGDFHKIIATTIEHISDKIEVEREVQTVISAKKMEQKIMNVIPVFIILYLNLTSGEFLAPLYGNIFGISVMTGALGAYLAAIKISAKMTAIKV